MTPRAVALDLLGAILDRRQPLEGAFGAHPALRGDALESRDRAFVRLLVATTLRRLGQIDAALEACLDRDLTPRARSIRNLLRLGACQLLFLSTPPHAAVAETVALATRRIASYRSLANAVLRRLARQGMAICAAQDECRVNLPDWLWRSWVAAYGEATTRAIAAQLLVEPPLDLSPKRDGESWARRLDADLLPTGSLRLSGSRAIADLPGYAEGAWWVQDAAAALPVRLLGEVAGRVVVDLCAAPGGKTAQLCAAGAKITAVDRSHSRIAVVRDNLERLRLSADLIVADARAWRPPAAVEHVLLDAPCTSTGTARRHPDILRIKRHDDVGRCVALQDRLLDAARSMLAPGGTLVYFTCSLEPEE
ncbi:MAG TPA: transcription antitermination factor NusB, partial [Alphaproteobacteria bacterium]|nr:transcription antitermination factor NusB [Alphaproteobacteria bacterium]